MSVQQVVGWVMLLSLFVAVMVLGVILIEWKMLIVLTIVGAVLGAWVAVAEILICGAK